VGRDHQLERLEEMLSAKQQPSKVALIGLGGVGKTQIALELAYRIRDRYPECSIFWVPATNSESLQQAYLEIGRQLQIPGLEQEQADVKKLVQGYLNQESAGRWLLIFDNADNIDMWISNAGTKDGSPDLIDSLPQSNQGSLVFTTRSRKVAVKLTQQNVIEVSEMDEELATQMLSKSLIDQDILEKRQGIVNLLKQLTFLPLAIVQAAAYINENGISLSDYLSLLVDQEENVVDLLSEDFEVDGRYRDGKNPVATTWLISFEQIRQRDPLAAEYLAFMSCVDPRDIPQSLLPPAQSRKKEMDSIGTLSAYSFVSRRSANNSLDVHRLVHLATRNWLRTEGSLAKWTARAVARLDEVFPDDDHKNRSVWRVYLPHVQYVLESSPIGDSVKTCLLLEKFGRCLYSDGRYNEAERSFSRVMETRTRVLGQEHPDTLTSIANLASTFWNQGRWKEAEELNMQVVETMKRVLGQEHPSTLTSMANLASTYRNQGRWKEAEELEMQVVETRKRVLGQEHPDTLTSMANLASTYRNQGRWKEAEELQAQELKICSRVLGQEHPSTLTSMANLALMFWNQGRLKEAEELNMQVVEMRKRVLGQEHPDTLTSIANLASTFSNQGRWKEAEELEMQVMETMKRVLGQEHPDTLTSMNNLAWTWKSQGRDREALGLIATCCKLSTEKLGADHPRTKARTKTLNDWIQK
jgi:tetratricopeptide (TPR) repeat protein